LLAVAAENVENRLRPDALFVLRSSQNAVDAGKIPSLPQFGASGALAGGIGLHYAVYEE
jgi:hypothetical protein